MKIIAWCSFLPFAVVSFCKLVLFSISPDKPDEWLDYTIPYAIMSTLGGLAAYFWFKYGVIQWLKDTFSHVTISGIRQSPEKQGLLSRDKL